MGRVADWSLVSGAATMVYINLYLVMDAGEFRYYWEAYTVALLLLGVGVIGKCMQAVAWFIRRMRGA